MKADSTGCRLAGNAPKLLGKAAELLASELTVRAWQHTQEEKCRTLRGEDVAAAVKSSGTLDFLVGVIEPADKLQSGARCTQTCLYITGDRCLMAIMPLSPS